MNARNRLSAESSRRSSESLKALRGRFDLTLAHCTNGMGLPTGADATLSRLEHGIGDWRYDWFDRFAEFAALKLNVPSSRLRATLLGDDHLAEVDDALEWNYCRWGSEPASKLLCRLQCHWRQPGQWVLCFREIPAFLLPTDAQKTVAVQQRRIWGRDACGEMHDVFEAMHNAFLEMDPQSRPRIAFAPLPGTMESLIGRRDAYELLAQDLLGEALEFLYHDCVRMSGSTFSFHCACGESNVVPTDTQWLLSGDRLAIRQRAGVPVLDYRLMPGSRHGDQGLAQPKRPSPPKRDDGHALRMLESVLQEVGGWRGEVTDNR